MSEGVEKLLRAHLDGMQKNFDDNWKHTRESLHDIRTEMAKLEIISMQMASAAEKLENIKVDVEKNTKGRETNEKNIVTIKTKINMATGLLTAAQAAAVAFFKLGK